MFKSIGLFPSTDLEEARAAVHRFNADLDKLKRDNYQGKNPFTRPRGEPALEELFNDYCERHLKQHAKKADAAVQNATWLFNRYLAPWRDRKISTIRRKDVLDLHAHVGEKHGHYGANRMIQLLRAVYNFGATAEVSGTEENPAARVKLFHEAKRKRFVQPDEMPKLFAALKTEANPNVVDFVNLSLWTGARKSDVLGMRWQDVSLADNKWEVPDPKNREPYQIALTPEAFDILKKRLSQRKTDNPWVFSSFGRTGHLAELKGRWRELLKRAGIENLRQHDLRRTLGS